ncbi:MAG: alkaline phosphatase family protein [Candidatus Baltobacteraceae bacterium]
MRPFVLGAVAAALLLAGCGGNGSVTPAASPPPVTSTQAVPTTAGSIALPAANGIASSLSIAAGAPSGLTVTATSFSTAPANAPAPSSALRQVKSVAGATPFLYVQLQFSGTLQASYLAGETLTLPTTPVASGGYYVEIDDTTVSPATKLLSVGPGTVSGQTVTIADPTTGNAVLPAFLSGHTYLLQFYTASAMQGQQIATSPIAHVIVVTMENRTPDNLFGNMQLVGELAAKGVVNIRSGGGPSIGLESPADPGHSYPELIGEWDGGKLDGFLNDDVTPSPFPPYDSPVPPAEFAAFGLPANFVEGTVPESEVEVYEALMLTYGFSDDFFSSRLVPSFPGHQFLVAGQSGASDDPGSPVWGCDAPASPSPLVTSFSANGTEAPGPLVTPCFSYNSLATLLDAKSITWKYYTGAPQRSDGNIDAYGAIAPIRYGPDWQNNISIPLTNIGSDITNCTLPSVSYVNAPAFASDHSGTLSAGGPGFVGDLYLQLIQTLQSANADCQYYNNTVMFVTWDDSGGWSDHVAPPKDSVGNSFGFRVPLIAISPYIQTGYLAATAGDNAFVLDGITARNPTAFYDFGSIMLYIEENYGLGAGALGTRDLDALNRGGDFTNVLFNYTRAPIQPLGGLLLTDFKRKVGTSSARATLAYPNEAVDDDK